MTEQRSLVSRLMRGTVEMARRGAGAAERPRFAAQRQRLAAKLRDLANRLEGAAYRVRGDRPDPDVDDQVLTQRVRSQLGPLEKRL
ncbi:MAG: hypothetical protein R3320_05825, partial [Nitriliruptorales bacterium]|nr:hypothetical protein [Nitriliruptorales bacterium]